MRLLIVCKGINCINLVSSLVMGLKRNVAATWLSDFTSSTEVHEIIRFKHVFKEMPGPVPEDGENGCSNGRTWVQIA